MPLNKETRNTLWWLIFIAIAAVLIALFLYPRVQTLRKNRQELKHRQERLAQKKRESEAWRRKVESLQNSPDAVEKEAREKFHRTRPGETVMIYRDPATGREK